MRDGLVETRPTLDAIALLFFEYANEVLIASPTEADTEDQDGCLLCNCKQPLSFFIMLRARSRKRARHDFMIYFVDFCLFL